MTARAVGAVVDGLRARAGDRAVGVRGVGQRVGVDGEGGRDGMFAVTLVSVRVAVVTPSDPADEVVAGVGAAVTAVPPAVVDGLRARAGDRAVRAGL